MIPSALDTLAEAKRKESLLGVLKPRTEYSYPDTLGQANMVRPITQTEISPDLEEKQISVQNCFLLTSVKSLGQFFTEEELVFITHFIFPITHRI